MTRTKDEALKLAREALTADGWKKAGDAIRAIDQALAAPVQDPVSGVVLRDGYPTLIQDKHIKETDKRLYTTPPAAPVPLTDDQIRGLTPKPDGVAEGNVRRVEVLPGVMGTEFDEVDAWSMPLVLQIARAIEAAHGITKGQP
jgi:hypothetical protein